MNKKRTFRKIAGCLSASMIATVFLLSGVSAKAGNAGNTLYTDETVAKLSVADSTDMLEKYMLEQVRDGSDDGEFSPITKNALRKGKLSKNTQKAYVIVEKAIKNIAAGKSNSSVISIPVASINGVSGEQRFTAKELGVSSITKTNAASCLYKALDFDGLDVLVLALEADMPYELYWSDLGYLFSFSGIEFNSSGTELIVASDAEIILKISVSADYSASGKTDTTTINTAKTKGVSTAIKNAKDIIKKYQSKNDFEKLNAYKEEICNLVSYDKNYKVGQDNYGNNSQLIYVFDGKKSTNVVCEGYSKAFKFLCDSTTFKKSSIVCYTVTGKLTVPSGTGDHMWNVVHMSDGKNYLVDITNCDDGSIGTPDKLFMVGNKNGTTDSYSYTIKNKTIKYTYSSATKVLYSAAERELAKKDYSGSSSSDPEPDPKDNKIVAQSTSGKAVTACDVTFKTNGTVVYNSSTSRYEDIVIPKTITAKGTKYKVTAIKSGACKNNTKIKSVEIPSTLKTIGKNAFNGAKNLSTITIYGNSLKAVGKNAFAGINKKATFRIVTSKKATYNAIVKKLKASSSNVKKCTFKKVKG